MLYFIVLFKFFRLVRNWAIPLSNPDEGMAMVIRLNVMPSNYAHRALVSEKSVRS